ncbi:hypothetical protein PSEUBRA_004657 [Kalmanozyma brasiliensis GHG001]|uniref:AB hydrolase-1 domain-containing protein n=1 Tax=Kalmanozyma brasiliensis (strain GHG001) TaxID=1365824 RepID=V5EWN2_KALBG|nr:uncharacterized protein PSEUBRA_004657 [Kalmanozyma brasiliensis GHG001]EST06734.1 hypothetical protein PSEUBRA_004657 [Kalmanozyma brasiliensis GHG001]
MLVLQNLLALLPLAGLASAASIRLDARNNGGSSGVGSISYAQGPYGLHNARCEQVTLQVPVNIELSNFTSVRNQYDTQSYITRQIIDFSLAPANWTARHGPSTTEKFTLNRSFQINGYYCTPIQGAREGSALWNLVHGIGFDSSYWDYTLSPEYSVVRHAASYGYSTFRYDRLGTGASETPSTGGFDVLRAQTEVAIYQGVLQQLRNTNNVGGKQHSKIVGIGHSYGSVQTQAVSMMSPELLDGVVLTGYTTNATNLPGYLHAAAYQIAKNTLSQLSNKPPVWLASGSEAGNQIAFFYPPYFSDASFRLARATEQPVTLGSLFSIGAVGGPSNFTGPVQVVNGAKDFIFCSSNCWGGPNGTAIPDGVKELYPQAKNFTSYIAENTGHGITAHYAQPMIAEEIARWIADQGL